MKPHELTRQVMVGSVPMGGGAPVVVQSMLNAQATDVAANLRQIDALAEAGCEVVRMAIPRKDCLDAFEQVVDALGGICVPVRTERWTNWSDLSGN